MSHLRHVNKKQRSQSPGSRQDKAADLAATAGVSEHLQGLENVQMPSTTPEHSKKRTGTEIEDNCISAQMQLSPPLFFCPCCTGRETENFYQCTSTTDCATDYIRYSHWPPDIECAEREDGKAVAPLEPSSIEPLYGNEQPLPLQYLHWVGPTFASDLQADPKECECDCDPVIFCMRHAEAAMDRCDAITEGQCCCDDDIAPSVSRTRFGLVQNRSTLADEPFGRLVDQGRTAKIVRDMRYRGDQYRLYVRQQLDIIKEQT